jgi:anti-sigma regulatory factor (Ser/Thr protein kinase)
MVCLLTGRSAVRQATDAARSFGQRQGLSDDNIARLTVVIEELVANLFEHGGVDCDDQVELMLAGEPEGNRVILIDPGEPFDPRSAPTDQGNSERGGGVGLDLIRSWAEIIGYEVTGDGNRLEFLLPLR